MFIYSRRNSNIVYINEEEDKYMLVVLIYMLLKIVFFNFPVTNYCSGKYNLKDLEILT